MVGSEHAAEAGVVDDGSGDPRRDLRRAPGVTLLIVVLLSAVLPSRRLEVSSSSLTRRPSEPRRFGLRLDPSSARAGNTQAVAANVARADERLRDVADDLRALAREGLSLNATAKRLNDLDVKTSRGCAWTATAVRRAILRLER
jgi:hypothetical protein